MGQCIRDVMTVDPVTLPASATVRDAAAAMDRADIGDVVVLNAANEVGGILTDRDIAIRVVAEGLDPATTKLAEICTSEIQTLTPCDTVGEANRLMRRMAICRLPVVEGRRIVGIASLGQT